MSWYCNGCGHIIAEGMGHACVPQTYATNAPYPVYTPGRYTWTPNSPTAEEIRKIVREEIERAKHADDK